MGKLLFLILLFHSEYSENRWILGEIMACIGIYAHDRQNSLVWRKKSKKKAFNYNVKRERLADMISQVQ